MKNIYLFLILKIIGKYFFKRKKIVIKNGFEKQNIPIIFWHWNWGTVWTNGF